ncbi:MAG: chemotaxis protein CheA, partial [Pseudomonadota bacterium]
MGFSEDDEILEDFLVEAGEILEQLSDQLVQLEQQPRDGDLLNAIFRGFHTVKGGAGFLQLTPLVDLCHITENLFDYLRNGQLSVTTDMMDVVLQALDALNAMFEDVKNHNEPDPADPALIASLEQLVQGEAPSSVMVDDVPPLEEAGSDAGSENRSDADDDDLITEEEFDALLDELHGAPAKPVGHDGSRADAGGQPESAPATPAVGQASEASSSASDEISEDEFEALLDQLHGAGAHGGRPRNEVAPTPPPPKPAPAGAGGGNGGPPDNGVGGNGAGNNGAQPKRDSGGADTSVRVDTRRLDEIMNMVGELVLVRNRLVRIGSDSGDEILSRTINNLDLVTADLQSSVMKTRMQPVKKVFGRFPRVVRDLARGLKKEVTLEMQGEETDLDKNLVEALADPLVHLVRNAVDHGIEMPDERERVGKPRNGTVLLAAEQEGDHILLSIQDDGAGMDPDGLRRKAVDKGVMDAEAAARLTDSECFDLIFAPGFSTKQEISDVSGRGVGMDVVKTKISQLNGTVTIDSKKGQGSHIKIKVPLTLAILPTLMVIVGDQTFALPLSVVNEIFNLDLNRTNVVDGRQVVTVRDKALPLFHLQRWLCGRAAGEAEHGDANVVIVNVGSQRIGFVVDSLIGQEEVVIKPLGHVLQGTPGMAGATITGDGRIA